MIAEAEHWLFTVDDYHGMAAAGILTEDDRVELINGEIVRMSPIGSGHAACVDFLTQYLVVRLGPAAIVRVQSPIRIDRYSEPQPDLTLLKPRDDFYRLRLPSPEDVILVLEVSDTTLRHDRDVKLPLYAGAFIPEVWIVDLQDRALERHTKPSSGSYHLIQRATEGGELESTVLPELVLNVEDMTA